VAKKGNGWLRREMGGKEGRWVAKKGDGWPSREMAKLGRWVPKLVALLIDTASSLGSNPDIS
jgi:hypothetical protein